MYMTTQKKNMDIYKLHVLCVHVMFVTAATERNKLTLRRSGGKREMLAAIL